jgi:hypothetical protein
LVLEEGLGWQPLGIPPEQGQFLESRQFQKTELLCAFLPNLLLAEGAKLTYGNTGQLSVDMLKFAIGPWLRKIETELNRKLFPERDYYVEFNPDQMLRVDAKTRYETYAIAGVKDWLTTDEVREMENRAPLEEDQIKEDQIEQPQDKPEEQQPQEQAPAVDPAESPQDVQTLPELVLNGAQVTAALELIQQVAQGLLPRDAGIGMLTIFFNLTQEQAEQIMGSVGAGFVPEASPTAPAVEPQPTEIPADQPPPNEDQQRKLRSLLSHTLDRIQRKEAKALDNAKRKYADDSAGFTAWVAEFYGEGHRDYIRNEITPVTDLIGIDTAEVSEQWFAQSRDLAGEYSANNPHTFIEELWTNNSNK